VISALPECSLCFVTVLAGAIAQADAEPPLRDVLATAQQANLRLALLAAENLRRRTPSFAKRTPGC
jgi:ferredoxin